jgi:hypothetical protein
MSSVGPSLTGVLIFLSVSVVLWVFPLPPDRVLAHGGRVGGLLF